MKKHDRLYNLEHLKTFRRELRNSGTPAEAELWKQLKGRQLDGKKFRRQHSIGPYIVDFFCPEVGLAIELDGNPHQDMRIAESDQQRTEYLASVGIRVIRFENQIILDDMAGVLAAIRLNLDRTTPSPSFAKEGNQNQNPTPNPNQNPDPNPTPNQNSSP